jgi:hypothetical protein
MTCRAFLVIPSESIYVVQRLCSLFALLLLLQCVRKVHPDSVPIDAPISSCSTAQVSERANLSRENGVPPGMTVNGALETVWRLPFSSSVTKRTRDCPRGGALSRAFTDWVPQFRTKCGIDYPGEAGVGNRHRPSASDGQRLDGVGLNADERGWLV